MINKLTNVSIAVNSIQEAAELYGKLFGLKLMRPASEPSQYGYRAAWLGNGKEQLIELLEPSDPNSAIGRFIKSRGEGVYLVSVDVDDLAAAVRQVRANGGRVTGVAEGQEPGPHTRVVWVHPSSTKGVFIQLQRSN